MQVYGMLMDSRKHQSLSDEKAEISDRVGGRFTAWGKHISDVNLVLKPGEKIVQAWRATESWPDHYSLAIFELRRIAGGGPKLRLRDREPMPQRKAAGA